MTTLSFKQPSPTFYVCSVFSYTKDKSAKIGNHQINCFEE